MTTEACGRPLPYWNWIEHEAGFIKTDGCSRVTGAYRRCCWVHDLSYYYGRDPAEAYEHYARGGVEPWSWAQAITRAQADADFRRCMQAHSAAGFWSPLALLRWAGVRVGGRRAWAAHRAREREDHAT